MSTTPNNTSKQNETLGRTLTLYAKHFVTQFHDKLNPSPIMQRLCLQHSCCAALCSRVWQCDLIICNVVKTFETTLCTKARLAVLKLSKSTNPQFLLVATYIQQCSVCLAPVCTTRSKLCRHYAKWTTPSTDESINDKRVNPTEKIKVPQISTDTTYALSMYKWQHCKANKWKWIISYLFQGNTLRKNI